MLTPRGVRTTSDPPGGTAMPTALRSTGRSAETCVSSVATTWRSRELMSARVKSSTSRHVVSASGPPSTATVMVTTRSVEIRIRRRTRDDLGVEAEPDAAHRADATCRRRAPVPPSSASLRRSHDMCMSRVFDVFISGSFHTSRRISSRETTCPACAMSTRRSSNSLLASPTSTPSTVTRRADGSSRTPPASSTSGARRRSSARTRASSSASRKGLPT